MSWNSSPGATGYEFKLLKVVKGSEKIFSIDKINSTVWSKSLAPGDYAFQIRAFDYRGVAGKWGQKQIFKVSLPTVKQISPVINQSFDLIEDEEINITLAWDEIPEADKYNLRIMAPDKSIIQNESLTDTAASFDFEKPGKYYWKVTALTSKDNEPKRAEFKKFFIIHPPKMPAPEVRFDVNEKFFSVFWESSTLSHKDKISIYHKRDGKWTRIFKDQKRRIRKVNLIKNKIPKGNYKLKLTSFTKEGRSSEPSTVYFKWDQKDLSAIQNKNQPSGTSSGNLADRFGKTPWSANFGISMISGELTNRITETDQITSSGYIGNSYNMNISRQYAKGKYSWSTEAHIANVINKDDNWLLLDTSTSFNYHLRDGIHDFTTGAGISYKSLPFISADESDTIEEADANANEISFISLKTNASYYYAINDAISFGAGLNLSINALSVNHPLGYDLDTSISSRYSIGAKYTLTKNLAAHFYYDYFGESLNYNGDDQLYTGDEVGLNININF